MKYFFGILFLSSLGLAANLECTGSYNFESQFKVNVELKEQQTVSLPEVEGLRPKVKSLGKNQFELDIFHPPLEARFYAAGVLKEVGDAVKWAQWDREALFEIVCLSTGSRKNTALQN